MQAEFQDEHYKKLGEISMEFLKKYGRQVALFGVIAVSLIVACIIVVSCPKKQTPNKIESDLRNSIIKSESDQMKLEQLTVTSVTAHNVKNGDNLWDLSQTYYKRHFPWPIIYFYNTNSITFPDLIIIGKSVNVPTYQTNNEKIILAMMYYDLYKLYKKCGWKKYAEGMLYMSSKYDIMNTSQIMDDESKIDYEKLRNGKPF
jgi:hypothetical protein